MATIEENLQQIANDVNSIKTNLGLSSNASLQDVVNESEGVVKPTGTVDITENGTVDVTAYASASVNVSGGSSMNIQHDNTIGMSKLTSGADIGVNLVVAVTGTYTLRYFIAAMYTSGTMGIRVMVNNAWITDLPYHSYSTGELRLTEDTNISLTQGDILKVWATSKSTSNTVYGGALTIIQTA